jgi:putative DNA primase/helicase
MTNLEAALVYAKHFGWHVFPVRPDKKPYTPNGLYDASNDPAVVTRWWTQFPNAAIGLRTGAESGVIVLDVDIGKDGFETLARQTAEHGALPETIASITGGGGRHYFFNHPGTPVRNTVGRTDESPLGRGLDFRGDGGYVILPPSKHASGNLYAWETPPISVQPAALPAWIFEKLNNRAPRSGTGLGNPVAATDAILDGGRNDALFKVATVLRAQGMEEEDILLLLITHNARCQPPLEDNELRAIARSACRYEAGPQLVEEWDESNTSNALISGGKPLRGPSERDIQETDLGNAYRLVERHGNDLRYVSDWKKWLVWTGSNWQADESLEVDRRCNDTAEAIVAEVRAVGAELAALTSEIQAETQAAASSVDSGGGVDPYALDRKRQRAQQLADMVKFLTKHARESQSERALVSMRKRAATLSEVAISVDQLDRETMLLNCSNGTLDLRTGNLRPHNRGDLLTRFTGVPYHPEAPCDRWTSFLLEIMEGDQEMVDYLQRAVAYSLTGSVAHQCVFFLLGGGQNGKSSFIEVLQALLGPYAGTASPDVLTEGDRHKTELVTFCGRRFMYIGEPKNKRLDTDRLKRLASAEPILARRMREDEWTFTPTHKLWIAANVQPSISEADQGTWRRLHMVPFNYIVPAHKKVPDFAQRALIPELPGILAWAVRAVADVMENGLRPPQKIIDATNEYREEEDVLGNFISETCQLGPGFTVGAQELYDHFTAWAERSGNFRVGSKTFYRGMAQKLGGSSVHTKRGNVYQGIRKSDRSLEVAQ